MGRTVEEIYEDSLKLTEDEREVLEVLLRLSLPEPDGDYAAMERASIERDRRRDDSSRS